MTDTINTIGTIPSTVAVKPATVQLETATKGSIGFLLLLTLLNVLNVVDRQLLAAFSTYIVPDLELTNTEFGLLTGLVFLFFYSVMGLFMGMLADKVNRTRLITVGLILWSALTALSGAAKGFVSMAIPRMFIGVGESILTPSAMSLLADRFPPSRLGFASGFYYLGVPIGGAASLLIAGYLGPVIGWRGCFYFLGALGLAFAVVMWFIKETPRRHLANAEPGSPKQSLRFGEVARTAMRTISRSPALMFTIAGATAMHFMMGAAAFEQLWFVEERGYERAQIAQLTGWAILPGGVLGIFVGGIGSDWFTKKTGLGRLTFLCGILLVLTPFSLALRLAPGGSIWIPLGLFFGMFQIGAFYGPTFATVQELVPPQVRSTVVAFFLLVVSIIGVGLGVTVAGFAIDAMIAQGVEQPYSLALLGFTLISFLAIPCFLFAGLRFAQDKARLYEDNNLL
ncbi:MAG TPA: MFS transporter [Porticoccus sp.]|nr:MFS transporter [Porticoccus sp.]